LRKIKIIVTLSFVLGFIFATYFYFKSDPEEFFDNISNRLEPPIGCPREKVEAIFGKEKDVWAHVVQGRYCSSYIYQLKPYKKFNVLLFVVYVKGRVYKSNVCLQSATIGSNFQKLETIEDQLQKIKGDIEFRYAYGQAVKINCDLYEDKINKLKSQQWPVPSIEGLLELPEINGSHLTAITPLLISTYVNQDGALFLEDRAVSLAELKEGFISVRKTLGSWTHCHFYVHRLAKVDCRLFNTVRESGLREPIFIGSASEDIETFCRPLTYPGPPPPESVTVQQKILSIKLNKNTCTVNGDELSSKDRLSKLQS
jgi:hypothetical protein